MFLFHLDREIDDPGYNNDNDDAGYDDDDAGYDDEAYDTEANDDDAANDDVDYDNAAPSGVVNAIVHGKGRIKILFFSQSE